MEGDGAVVVPSEVTCLGLSDALRSGGVELRARPGPRPTSSQSSARPRGERSALLLLSASLSDPPLPW